MIEEPRPKQVFTFESQAQRNLAEPAHQVFCKSLRQHEDDPEKRSLMAATFAVSLWQQFCRAGSQESLSLFMLHGKSGGELAEMHRRLADPPEYRSEFSDFEGCFSESAKESMEKSFQSLIRLPVKDRVDPRSYVHTTYQECREDVFARGRVNFYHRAWHPQIGLITDRRNALNILLADQKDREAFLRDMKTDPDNIWSPRGPDTSYEEVRKRVSVSGAWPVEELSEELVSHIVIYGLPVLFLPDHLTSPLKVTNWESLDLMTLLIGDQVVDGRMTCRQFTANPKSLHYYQCLWLELIRVPPGYRNFLIDLMQRMEIALRLFDAHLCRLHNGHLDDEGVLAEELIAGLYQGMYCSVLMLAWYGYGSHTSLPPNQFKKLLGYLRNSDGVSLREIPRKMSFKNAKERDCVLDGLEKDHLITIEGKQVSPVSFDDFCAGLYARIPHWDEAES